MSNDLEEHDVIQGEVPDALEQFEDNSFHAVVTDPPYGLAFMGKSWDDFEPKEYQEWCQNWAEEVLRVLKPGGHMLAFSGSRTFHRLQTGVEDAGFTIRDTVTWHYGSGFPKGANISKDIQKKKGVEPESIDPAEGVGFMNTDDDGWHETKNQHTMPEPKGVAKAFDGFNTALKPSTEFVCVARNPLEEDTIAENVMEHGTGGLNIDATRIGTAEDVETPWGERKNPVDRSAYGDYESDEGDGYDENWEPDDGRYPANLVLSHSEECSEEGCVEDCPVAMLDEQSGDLGVSRGGQDGSPYKTKNGMFKNKDSERIERKPGFGDEGGASRFFYTSKASKAERNANGAVENNHPTVKPVDLMEWLVKMVTAEGQKILDPFLGSGTTLIAAENTNRICTGIDQSEEYIELAKERARHSCPRLNHNSAMEW